MAKIFSIFINVIAAIKIKDKEDEPFSIKKLLSTSGEFDQSEFNKVLIRKDGLNHILLSDVNVLTNALATEFPDIIKVESIGETWQGRPINVVSLDATNYFKEEAAVQTDDSDKNEDEKSKVEKEADQSESKEKS
jgi:hypothetical protein